MAFGLDIIKEGLSSLESGLKDTVRKATNQGGLKGSALQKKKAKEWSRTKEGKAMLDVALSIGLTSIDAVTTSADAAEGFLLTAEEKKMELMEIGRKLYDKKSYEATEAALDLEAEIADYAKKTSKDFKAGIVRAMKDAKDTASDTASDALDAVKDAKTSSSEYTSKMVKEVSASAKQFKKELSEEYGIQASALDMLLDDASGDVSKVMSDLSDLGSKTAEELKAMGLTKIEAYTRKNGDKVPEHYRKRAR